MKKTRGPRRSAAPAQQAREQPAAKQKKQVARSAWRRHGWRLLLLWTLLAAAYSNSFDAGLVFDNAPILSQDPRIQAATAAHVELIFRGDYWYHTGTSGLYRPLTTLSYLFNYAVLGNGVHPAGYHAINLALHAANAALVYGLGIAVLGEPGCALAMAALWGLHPLLTESVTNIVGRADLLAALGVLAGLLFHTRRRGWGAIAGIAAAQTLGIFSKESAIVLPALMLLYDLAFVAREKWRVSSYAAAILPIALFFSLRAASHPHFLINFPENPLIGAGFWTARLTAVKVIGKFLWLFVWPANLCADYSYNAMPLVGSGGWEDVKALLAAAICAAGIALLVVCFKKSKPLFFCNGFFWIALLPTSNLILLIGAIMAERFMYLPLVGLIGGVVAAARIWTGIGLWSGARRAAWAMASLVCIAFAARTYARNFDWHDGTSLWSSAVAVNPQAARSHNNLGYEFEQIPGRLPDAIAEYRTALQIRPDYAEADYNLGNALARTHRLPEAIAAFESAVKIAPNYVEAHNNLGSALLESGSFAGAIAEFQAALRIQPDYAEAHNNLGNALSRIPGRLPDAIAEFETAVRIRPDYAEAHNNLGNALARTPGQLPAAVTEYKTALRIEPDYVEADNNLGNAFAQMPGHTADAVAEYQAALQVNPNYAEAHANLGSALLASGRVEDAISEYQTATRLAPGLVEAHIGLGEALLQISGRTSEAIAEFEAALRIRPDPQVRQILERLRARP